MAQEGRTLHGGIDSLARWGSRLLARLRGGNGYPNKCSINGW